MEKTLLVRHLAEAQMHLEAAELHVKDQRKRIAELAEDGHNVRKAEALLVQFENSLALHATNRDRIAREVREADSAGPGQTLSGL